MTPKKRKNPRRTQIKNIDEKGYFKRPLTKRRFTTKRIMRGDIRTISSRSILINLYNLMNAKLKTKVSQRESIKNSTQEINENERKVISAIQRSGERSIKKRRELGIEGGTAKDAKTAIEEYMDFRVIQGRKFEKMEKKAKRRISLLEEQLRKTKKSKRISSTKGRLDSVIINLAGIPVMFEVNKRTLALIEEKLRPQTVLEPKGVAIRRILIKNPKRRIVTIIKNLKAQGLEVDELFVAKIIRKMIDENLINRNPPKLNNNITKK